MEENLSTRLLLTELTPDEKVARGEEMGNLIAEIESLQEQLKAASGGIKAKITDAKKKERRLGHILATGKEEREVQVKTVKDWEHKEVTLIRLDTGAEVERRTMTASEAQADLLDRGAEPGKLLALDGGRADGGAEGDAQQPELSEDEKVWADAIDGTGKHFEDDEEEDSPIVEADGAEEGGEGEDAPAPEPDRAPKRSPRKKKESA